MLRATLPAGATALARVLEVAVCRVDVCKFVKRLVAYLEAVDRDGESSPADPPRPRLDSGAGLEEEKAVDVFLLAVGLVPNGERRWGLPPDDSQAAGEVLRRVLGCVDMLQDYMDQGRRGADGAFGALGCAAKAGQGLSVVRDAAKALPTLPGQLPALLGQLQDGELIDVDGIANDAVRRRLVALFDVVGLERQMSLVEGGAEGEAETGYGLPRAPAEAGYVGGVLGLLSQQLETMGPPGQGVMNHDGSTDDDVVEAPEAPEAEGRDGAEEAAVSDGGDDGDDGGGDVPRPAPRAPVARGPMRGPAMPSAEDMAAATAAMHKLPPSIDEASSDGGDASDDSYEGEGPVLPANTTAFYELLGVEKTAKAGEIKKAFHKRALKAHPDKGGNAAEFKRLQEAYDVLKDEEKRAMYDEYGHKKFDIDELKDEEKRAKKRAAEAPDNAAAEAAKQRRRATEWAAMKGGMSATEAAQEASRSETKRGMGGREEWMMVPPADDGLLSGLKRKAVEPRGFQQMAPHTSQWAAQGEDDGEGQEANPELEKQLKEHREARGASLYEHHQKKFAGKKPKLGKAPVGGFSWVSTNINADASTSTNTNTSTNTSTNTNTNLGVGGFSWDRDEAMGATRKMDMGEMSKMIADAQALDSKFSRSVSKQFM